jgi:hypothetical protein
VLFSTRLEIAAQAPRLHTVVRGTPVSGYRLFEHLNLENIKENIKEKEETPAHGTATPFFGPSSLSDRKFSGWVAERTRPKS